MSGTLSRLSDDLASDLADCHLCPRHCAVDRTAGPAGRCGTGALARVDAAFAHFGEEPCLVGRGGSGTIFFGGCGLGCIFCQNASISRGGEGREMTADGLAGLMLALQQQGCQNVNLVTPTHVLPQCVSALDIAVRRGLSVPLVCNAGGYEDPGTLRRLDGVFDLFLPDLKTLDAERGRLWFGAPDYPEVACAALREMHRQVGDLVVDADGIARRGLLVRHLVMPGAIADATAGFRFLASVAPGTAVNVMDQYRPLADAMQFPGIDRRATAAEVEAAREAARGAGLRVL